MMCWSLGNIEGRVYKERMKHIFTFALSVLMSAPAFASETPDTVVELFTSQGCSSCPPANEFVANLAEDTDKLVLSYGVTYWDYLGWEDTFGDIEFTQRQKDYGKSLQTGNIYTPQIVLNGAAHSPRYSKDDVETMPLPPVAEHVALRKVDDHVEVTVPPSLTDRGIRVVIVAFTPGVQDVNVSKGENRGRTLRLANVVTDVTNITLVKNEKGLAQAAVARVEGQAYAALVHDSATAKVLSAAVLTP